jgi:4-diphosphocytidyl-2C-methyl-D-erythritol kinase
MTGKSPAKVELFFYILLTDDILYHHYKLKSTMDVLEEKLKIVSFLRMKSPYITITA